MLFDLRPTIAPLGNFVATPLSLSDVPVVSAAQPTTSPASAPPALRARRLRRPLSGSFAALVCATALLGACAHRGQEPAPPAEKPAASFIDAPLLGAQGAPVIDPEGGASARIARLDRLLDLFDAARFAGDQGARESLWEGLGGASMGRGHEASREALARLLDEALAIEDLAGLSEDDREFVASALLLLTSDLHRPTVADDLSIQTAAYRELVQHGHPRIVDNARWRVYDHIRGCLEGAISAPPERRPEIAVHSLYAAEESIEGHLDDKRSTHAKPSLPPPVELWAMLDAERQALASIDRWAPVLQLREADDQELRSTALAALPAPRDPTWEIAAMPAGSGRAESLAPVIRVDGETLIIDEGRPQERRERLGSPEAARALEGALIEDGRGIVLFVAPTMLPSPTLQTALRALLSARVATVEFAVHEPRLGDDAGDVVLALPLEVLRESDRGPASLALREARIHVHLDGHGPRLAIDGRWMSTRPSGERELGELLGRLDQAFPRERLLTLTIGPDVLLQQLLDLMRMLIGGTDRRYDVAAWSVDRDPENLATPSPKDAEDRRVDRRAALYSSTASATLDQPFPLPKGDQQRLETLARQLTRCIPEIEATLPAAGLRLDLSFEEGKIREVKVSGKRKRKAKRRGKNSDTPERSGVEACVDAESRGFRLREQRDPITIGVVLKPS